MFIRLTLKAPDVRVANYAFEWLKKHRQFMLLFRVKRDIILEVAGHDESSERIIKLIEALPLDDFDREILVDLAMVPSVCLNEYAYKWFREHSVFDCDFNAIEKYVTSVSVEKIAKLVNSMFEQIVNRARFADVLFRFFIQTESAVLRSLVAQGLLAWLPETYSTRRDFVTIIQYLTPVQVVRLIESLPPKTSTANLMVWLALDAEEKELRYCAREWLKKHSSKTCPSPGAFTRRPIDFGKPFSIDYILIDVICNVPDQSLPTDLLVWLAVDGLVVNDSKDAFVRDRVLALLKKRAQDPSIHEAIVQDAIEAIQNSCLNQNGAIVANLFNTLQNVSLAKRCKLLDDLVKLKYGLCIVLGLALRATDGELRAYAFSLLKKNEDKIEKFDESCAVGEIFAAVKDATIADEIILTALNALPAKLVTEPLCLSRLFIGKKEGVSAFALKRLSGYVGSSGFVDTVVNALGFLIDCRVKCEYSVDKIIKLLELVPEADLPLNFLATLSVATRCDAVRMHALELLKKRTVATPKEKELLVKKFPWWCFHESVERIATVLNILPKDVSPAVFVELVKLAASYHGTYDNICAYAFDWLLAHREEVIADSMTVSPIKEMIEDTRVEIKSLSEKEIKYCKIYPPNHECLKQVVSAKEAAQKRMAILLALLPDTVKVGVA